MRALHYKQQISVDNLWFEIWICLYTCTQKVALNVSSAEGLWKREKLIVRCTMYLYCYVIFCHLCRQQGRIQGGGASGAPPPPKKKNNLKNKWFIGVKSWFCHTKYPKMFCASLRSAQFFKVRPPNLKSWIGAWTIYVFAEKQTRNAHQRLSSIGTVIVSVLASSAVDRGFESRSGQTMFYTHILPSSTFCWKFMI